MSKNDLIVSKASVRTGQSLCYEVQNLKVYIKCIYNDK